MVSNPKKKNIHNSMDSARKLPTIPDALISSLCLGEIQFPENHY